MIRLPTDLSEILQHGGTVVVPTRQRAHAARLGYAAAQLGAGRRVWSTPDILPIDSWVIREVERRAAQSGTVLPRFLSPAEHWLLWRQCTLERTQDLELLNRGALAETLQRASALAAEFGIDVSKSQGMAGAEAQLLYETQQAVAERCRSLGAATVQTLFQQLLKLEHGPPPACRGFLKLSPRLEAIGATPGTAARESTLPRAIIAADGLDEIQRIAQWCQRRIEIHADSRLLVILPGGGGPRERLATLIRQAVAPRAWLEGGGATPTESPVIIEGGGSLAAVPVVAHALMTLGWLSGSRGEFGDVSEWLLAPYWNTPEPGARARIDLWLRERGLMDVACGEWMHMLDAAPADIAEAAQAIAKQLSNAAAALGNAVISPREWSERFRSALTAVNWPGNRARGSGEQQTVVRFHELLDEFGQLAASSQSMALADAIRWFNELAGRTAFRPADDDAAVTISGALADPIVLYDGIWVAGLHAEAFPQPVQPDPFLPLAAQLAAGIPAASASGRLEEALALVAAWRAATTELVLSAPARADDLELLPSPMLAQWLGLGALATVPPAARWLPERIHRANMLETFEDAIGIPCVPDHPLPGTRSIELQNLCGFRAYAELRLGSTELDVPEPGVAPDVRGRLLHVSLQKLWQQLRDSHTLSAHGEASLGALIEQSVAEAAEAVLGPLGGAGRSPLFARELRRTRRLIKTLCALESTRSPFRVHETELETTLTVAGALMNVRIDRLDTLESGGTVILDYKTGRRTPADWYGDRPSHPQLLAYLAAVGKDVVAMATVNVTAREVRFDGIASSAQLLPKVKGVEPPTGGDPSDAWQVRTREWLDRVEQLASEFIAGHAVVDPKPGACEYCHVISVCRISDRGIDAIPEADDIETGRETGREAGND